MKILHEILYALCEDGMRKKENKMKIKYKTIGPHVVVIPKGLEIVRDKTQPADPVMTPIAEALMDWELEGWSLVEIIPGFPLALGSATSLALPNGQRQNIVLQGVCALLNKIVE